MLTIGKLRIRERDNSLHLELKTPKGRAGLVLEYGVVDSEWYYVSQTGRGHEGGPRILNVLAWLVLGSKLVVPWSLEE